MTKMGQEVIGRNVSDILIAKILVTVLIFLTPLFLVIRGIRSGTLNDRAVAIGAASIIVLTIIFLFKYLASKPGATIEKHGAVEKHAKVTGPGMFSGMFEHVGIMAPTFAVLAVVVGLIWGIVTYSGRPRNYIPTRTVVQQAEAKPHSIASPKVQRGTIIWYKAGTAGSGDKTAVQIKRNDDEMMEFTSKYGTRYTWNKREESGRWYNDYPKDSGSWYLEQNGSLNSFNGWISDDKDKFVSSNQLELNIE